MPDGDKGREGERANGTAATEHTAGRRSGGQAEGRQEGRALVSGGEPEPQARKEFGSFAMFLLDHIIR